MSVERRSGALRRAMLASLISLGSIGGGACAGPLGELRSERDVHSTAGRIRIAHARENERDAEQVALSLERVAPNLLRWGRLRVPIVVRIAPTHDALEAAVRRFGYPWLRAWARFDEVILQAPATWGPKGASAAELDELLLHELTHSLMYQLASPADRWTGANIPLWFREGFASFNARQGYRWPSLEQLARFLDENTGPDPLLDPEALYQNQSDIVYSAAHHTFVFLTRRYGEGAVTALLAGLRAGHSFEDAFDRAVGVSEQTFLSDFRRYVRLRGFRGGRVPWRLRTLLHQEEPAATQPAPASQASGCHYP